VTVANSETEATGLDDDENSPAEVDTTDLENRRLVVRLAHAFYIYEADELDEDEYWNVLRVLKNFVSDYARERRIRRDLERRIECIVFDETEALRAENAELHEQVQRYEAAIAEYSDRSTAPRATKHTTLERARLQALGNSAKRSSK
jgi:hypothetical protein